MITEYKITLLPVDIIKAQGLGTNVAYDTIYTAFGYLVMARIKQGFFFGDFVEKVGDNRLKELLPKATYNKTDLELPQYFTEYDKSIDLCLFGTEFQIKVWTEITRIPVGSVKNYKEIATKIDKGTALKAVGNAVGDNTIALFLPCHRVVPMKGGVGNYRWGKDKKFEILNWERQMLENMKQLI